MVRYQLILDSNVIAESETDFVYDSVARGWRHNNVLYLESEITKEKTVAYKEQEVREKRNSLLTESDWTQIPDSPEDDDAKITWATYRQALRDITAHENFPDLAPEDWPTKP